MKKTFSSKAIRKMERDAEKQVWVDLVTVDKIPAFASWLTDDFHAWIGQSPDAGEILRAHKDGWTIVVEYDGRHTSCKRVVMALWHTFECFGEQTA